MKKPTGVKKRVRRERVSSKQATKLKHENISFVYTRPTDRHADVVAYDEAYENLGKCAVARSGTPCGNCVQRYAEAVARIERRRITFAVGSAAIIGVGLLGAIVGSAIGGHDASAPALSAPPLCRARSLNDGCTLPLGHFHRHEWGPLCNHRERGNFCDKLAGHHDEHNLNFNPARSAR